MTGDSQIAIKIREIMPEDVSDIISLLQQLWPDRELNHAALKNSVLRSFELSGHIIRIACFDDRAVGLCSISIRNNLRAEGNLANIDELVVDETMRGQRIGRLLLEDAEEIARENGCKVLGLESSFHRVDAHRFYEDSGYWKQGYYLTRDLD